MKKSTLYALTAVTAAIFSTLVVLENFGTLYALPLLVVSFLCLSFYVSVCDFNQQK